MNSRIPLLLAVFLFPMCSALGQMSMADSALKSANGLYAAGSYESAELAARHLMEQGPVADSVRVEAERIIAFSLVAQGKTDLARDHFDVILAMRPSFELDPVLTSPKILAVFAEAKLRSAAARKSALSQSTEDRSGSTEISFRAILFPGWEQSYRGRSGVGLVFVGAGALTLGSAITFEILRGPARRDYLSATQPADISGKYNTYNRYYRGEVYSFIAFAVVYVASELDVFLNNGRGVEIQPSGEPAKGPGLVLSLHW